MTVDLNTKIREVQDFPTPGVGFKDITPLLADPEALQQTIDALAEWVREKKPDVVLGAEARGFILGAAIAAEAGCGFVPARRPGSCRPRRSARPMRSSTARTRSSSIPTSSPARASSSTTTCSRPAAPSRRSAASSSGLGGEVVGACFIIELTFLGGRERLEDLELKTLIEY